MPWSEWQDPIESQDTNLFYSNGPPDPAPEEWYRLGQNWRISSSVARAFGYEVGSFNANAGASDCAWTWLTYSGMQQVVGMFSRTAVDARYRLLAPVSTQVIHRRFHTGETTTDTAEPPFHRLTSTDTARRWVTTRSANPSSFSTFTN